MVGGGSWLLGSQFFETVSLNHSQITHQKLGLNNVISKILLYRQKNMNFAYRNFSFIKLNGVVIWLTIQILMFNLLI